MHQQSATLIRITPPSLRRRRPYRVWFARAAVIAVLVDIVLLAGVSGLRLRRWVWDVTDPVRFTTDIHRGFGWGHDAAVQGFLNEYDRMQPQQPGDENWLDYAPLRLGVMTLWGRWAARHFPDVSQWEQNRSYAFTAPVLHVNTAMELIGVVCAFLLTRLWVIRGGGEGDRSPPDQRPFFRGCFAGLVAALLLWFNPAILISAYGWPTWDMWIVPMFLLAALLASVDWWFTAGLAVGIGAMFKGQQLTIAPVFLLWALILGKPSAALKWAIGVIIAMAVIASPWLITYIPPDALAAARLTQNQFRQAWQAPLGTFKLPRVVDWPALLWVTGVFVITILPAIARAVSRRPHLARREHAPGYAENLADAALAHPMASRTDVNPACVHARLNGAWARSRAFFRSSVAQRAILAVFVAAWVVWPWLIARNRAHFLVGAISAAALATLVTFVRRRNIRFVATGAVGAALPLCMSLFHGSTAWWDCGFHFGTVHWPYMTMGLTDNLPGILAHRYGWTMEDLAAIVTTIPAHAVHHWPAEPIDVTIRQLLLAIYGTMLLLSGIGLGLHARRRDRRVLAALVTPWLMFFCFPPQIHERYLLFAAGAACLCAGVSVGMTLLGVFLSLVTFVMTLHCMMANNGGQQNPQFDQWLAQQFPRFFDSGDAAGKVFRFFEGTHPDLGWAVLLCGGIFLYFTLAQRWRATRAIQQ